jgi:predicted  nucleic acid-binding Zn-ribbon protein
MRRLIVLVATVALAACERSKPQLERTLKQVQQISAEKDSLLHDVMATSQFIADVNSDLAKVRSAGGVVPVAGKGTDLENSLTPDQQREAIRAKIAELAKRLVDNESHLAASRARVKSLTAGNVSLAAQLTAYDSTIAGFKSIIDNQKSQIEALTERVNTLQAENASLKQEKAQLAGEKLQLTENLAALISEANKVYIVIGTRDELVKRHVVELSGGFLGFGKTIVPVRDPDVSQFSVADRTTLTQIPFPTEKPYRIVSRQDVASLDTPPGADGRIKGGLRILNADKFWVASKFLIVVEQ